MIPFTTTGAGFIKWGRITALNNGNYVVSYLLQHITDTGKKSHFTLKYFTDIEVDPYPKDSEIEFTGVLRENSYKDKVTNEIKTTGLEVIADTITLKEVF